QGHTAGGRPGPALDPRADADVAHGRARSHTNPHAASPQAAAATSAAPQRTVRVDTQVKRWSSKILAKVKRSAVTGPFGHAGRRRACPLRPGGTVRWLVWVRCAPLVTVPFSPRQVLAGRARDRGAGARASRLRAAPSRAAAGGRDAGRWPRRA